MVVLSLSYIFFNFPNIDWTNGGISSTNENSQENNFIDIMNEYGIEQLVKFPTRISDMTNKGSVSDLIQLILRILQNVSVEASISDHELVVDSVHVKGKENYITLELLL